MFLTSKNNYKILISEEDESISMELDDDEHAGGLCGMTGPWLVDGAHPEGPEANLVVPR